MVALLIYSQAPPDRSLIEELRPFLRLPPGSEIHDFHQPPPGAVIEDARRRWLEDAGVIVLFLSADFYHDPACHAAATEALRQSRRGARLVPVRLRPYMDDPALPLSALQPLPADGRPVSLQGRDRDLVWQEIATHLFQLCAAPLPLLLPPEEGGPPHPPQTTPSLEVLVPARDGEAVRYRIDGQEEQAFLPAGPAPSAARLPALMAALRADWPSRRGLLAGVARELASWLYGPAAQGHLRRLAERWQPDGPRRRVTLRVPPSREEWAWEIAAPPDLGEPLAVHPAFTVVRLTGDSAAPAPGPLFVHLCGPPAAVEQVRQQVQGAATAGAYTVRLSVGADPARLMDRDHHHAPLVHLIATPGDLAAVRPAGARLLLLQAAPGDPGLVMIPGPVAAALHQRGVVWVVGIAQALSDVEPGEVAGAFYASLARGEPVDVAVQRARRRLYLLGGERVGWAFLHLCAAAAPGPLLHAAAPAAGPSAGVLDFAHEDQRQRLVRFLRRRDPLVIIVHGDERRGHRHVMERVQRDLEGAGNVLWRPVLTLRWYAAGEPLLSRQQLAGALARALDLRDDGTAAALEERISQGLADRCSDGRVLVIDLCEVLCPLTAGQAAALSVLVRELWPDVMHRARDYRSSLPVFLLVGVAYPRPAGGRAVQKQLRELTRHTRELVSGLDRLETRGQVRVEVLPELREIDREYIVEFLRDTCSLSREQAEAKAGYVLVHGRARDDNERIIENMRQLMADLRST